MRIAAYFLGSLLSIVVLLVALLYVPFVQSVVVEKVSKEINAQINGQISIGSLHLGFPLKVKLDDVLLTGSQKDTLINAGKIRAGLALWPLMHGSLEAGNVQLAAVQVNMKTNPSGVLNLIEVFASADEDDSKNKQQDQQKNNLLLHIASLDLKNIRFSYTTSELDFRAHLHDFHCGATSLSLDSLKVQNDEIQLDGLDVFLTSLKMEKDTQSDDAPSSQTFLTAHSKLIGLKNISYVQMRAGDTLMHISNRALEIQKLNFNLASQSVQLEHLNNNDLHFNMYLRTADSAATVVSDSSVFYLKPGFDVGWDVACADLSFLQSRLKLHQSGLQQSYSLGSLHINNVVFNDVHNDLEINAQDFQADSISLQSLLAELKFNHDQLLLQDVHLETKNLVLSARAESKAHFPLPVDSLVFMPLQTSLKLEGTLPLVLARYIPEDYWILAEKEPLMFDIQANASGGDFVLDSLNARIGNFLNLQASAGIERYFYDSMPSGHLNLNFKYKENTTAAIIVQKLVPDINIPEKIDFQMEIQLDSLKGKTDIALLTNLGNLHLDGKIDSLYAYEANLSLKGFDLQELLQIDSLSGMNMDMQLKGAGFDLPTATADLKCSFSDISYRRADFDSLILRANWENSWGKLQLQTFSEYADLIITASGNQYNADAELAIKDVRLDYFHDRPLPSIWGNCKMSWSDTLGTQTAGIDIYNSGLWVDNKRFELAPFEARFLSSDTLSDLKITSGILNVSLEANRKPEVLLQSLQDFYQDYLHGLYDREPGETECTASIQLHGTSPVRDYFLPDLKQAEFSGINMAYREQDQHFEITASMPVLEYDKLRLSDMRLDLSLDSMRIFSGLQFAQISYDTINAGPLNWEMSFKDSTLHAGFKLGDTVPDLDIQIKGSQKNMVWHLALDSLIIAGKSWEKNEDRNYLVFDSSGIQRAAMQLVHQKEKLEFQKDSLHNELLIRDFDLDNLLSAFKGETGALPFDAKMDLDFKMADDTARIIELKLKDVVYQDLPPLNLSASLFPEDGGQKITAVADGEYFDMTANAFYSSDKFQLDADLKRFDLSALPVFMPNDIPKAGGELLAHLSFKDANDLQGQVHFSEASIRLAALNTTYRLGNEKIKFDRNTLQFDDFQLEDEAGQRIHINGGIVKPENDTSLKLDFQMDAKQFTFVNTERKTDLPYYGHVNADVKLNISGSLDEPVAVAELKLNKGSDFTYIYAPDRLNMVDDEGVVEFVPQLPGNKVLELKKDSVVVKSGFRGLKIQSNIKVDKEAVFRLYADFSSEDYIEIRGDADLDLDMNRDGSIRMAGRYEVSSGFYRMSFYNLVRKKFDVIPGSYINWYGSPSDANMDIGTKYSTRVSPLNLILTQVSQLSEAQKQRYRQKIPFTVMLYMKGSMLEPQISFGLSMDKEYRSQFPDVDAYVQELNRDGNADELNKQVFGVLVFNSFLSDASGGNDPASAMARDVALSSVNGLMNSQLERLSGRFLKGVDIEMNLEDYAASEGGGDAATQLELNVSKRFFNDRLQVKVGENFALSDNETARQEGVNELAGNYAVIYDLTPDGRFRIKAYRENSWDLIDGSIDQTGLSLMYEKEFMLKKRKEAKDEK